MGQRGYQSDLIEQNVNGRHSLSFDHSLKLGRTRVPLHIEAKYTTRVTGNNSLSISGRSSFNVRALRLTGEVLWEKQSRKFGPPAPGRLEAGLLASGRIGKVRLRGEARFTLAPQSRFETATIRGEWRAGDHADWRAELGYETGSSRARAGFGYVRRFDKFSLTTTAEAASDGSVAAGLNLAFSLGPDPRSKKIRFARRKLASSGQALAVVFRDRNGDGIRQADEPFEKDVELTAGQSVALTSTDRNGAAIIDSLQPFRPVLIGIDASSLSDPFVRPALPGVVITPRPGIATRVELPLVSSGEIDGTILSSNGGMLPGVDLELRSTTGRVVATTRSEFDGFFLFEGIPYGKYTITVAKLSAGAANIATQLGQSIDLNDGESLVNLGTIVATTNQKLASAEPQGP